MNNINNHINPFTRQNRKQIRESAAKKAGQFRDVVGEAAGAVAGRIAKETAILLRGNVDDSAEQVGSRISRSVSQRIISREAADHSSAAIFITDSSSEADSNPETLRMYSTTLSLLEGLLESSSEE